MISRNVQRMFSLFGYIFPIVNIVFEVHWRAKWLGNHLAWHIHWAEQKGWYLSVYLCKYIKPNSCNNCHEKLFTYSFIGVLVMYNFCRWQTSNKQIVDNCMVLMDKLLQRNSLYKCGNKFLKFPAVCLIFQPL